MDGFWWDEWISNAYWSVQQPEISPLQHDPVVRDEDKASLAYFLSDSSCKSFKLSL